jgi:nucleoid DNA-binding protein
MSGKIRGSKYISEDELEVLFVDNNKKAKEKEAEAEKKNKWLKDQVNDQDNNGMSSYGRLEVYENKLAAKPEKLILTKKEENDAVGLTETDELRAVVKDMANSVETELSDGYEIQRIRGVPAVNTKVLVLKDVIVNVRPMADGMDGGVIITVKKSNQIIRGLKNVTTRILNGIETLSGNRVKINNKRKRIRPQYFVIQDNKTPKEIKLEEAEDILNEKQEKMEEIIDKDDVAEIPNLGEFIIACDVDGREFKGTLRALRDDSSNGLEGKLENAERLQDALANVTIFLKEEHRNRKVKKNGK